MEQDCNDMPSFIKESSLVEEVDVFDNVELNLVRVDVEWTCMDKNY